VDQCLPQMSHALALSGDDVQQLMGERLPASDERLAQKAATRRSKVSRELIVAGLRNRVRCCSPHPSTIAVNTAVSGSR